MAQFGRPISDITNPSNWTGTFADIDEVTPDDGDYGWSADNIDDTVEFLLTSLTDPLVSVDHTVRFRHARMNGGVIDGGGTAPTFIAYLYQGTTLIRNLGGTVTPTGTWTTNSLTISTSEADNITDYSDLRIRFEYEGGGGSPDNRRGIGISWAELEIPNAANPIAGVINGVATVTGILTAKGKLTGHADVNFIRVSDNNSASTFGHTNLSFGQKFVGFNHFFGVDYVEFKLRRIGNPDFDLEARIYSISGGLPDSVLQTSSNIRAIDTISDSAPGTLYRWNFDHSITYTEDIAVVLFVVNKVSADTSNRVQMYIHNTSQLEGSNTIINLTNNQATWDCVMNLKKSLTTLGDLTEKTNDLILGTINGAATVTGILTAKGSLSGLSWTTYHEQLINTGFLSMGEFSGALISFGELFNNFNNKVESISIEVEKQGSPVFDIKAEIWDVSGGIPNTLLKTSNETITAASIVSIEFIKFTFDNTIHNEDVALVITITNHTSSDATNRIKCRINTKSKTPYGILTYRQFTGGSWAGISNQESVFKLQLNPVFGNLTTLPSLIDGPSDGVATVTGVLTAKGNMLGVANGIATTPGILIAKGNMLGVINGVATTPGILTGRGALVGVINGVATTDSDLQDVATDPIEGVIDGIATTAGILIANGILQGIINGIATVDGIASARGDLVGESDGIATVNGILTGKGILVGVINALATTQGDLTSRHIAGIINSVATTQGVLIAKGELASIVNAIATIQGILTAIGSLNGASNGVSTTEGILTAIGKLEGTINGITTTQGILITNALNGAANGVATVQGTLTAKGSLVGVSNGIADIQGDLTAVQSIGDLIGVINGVATTPGTLIGIQQILSSINGFATVNGILIAKGSLAGIINGIATTESILKGKGELLGVINGVATVDGLMFKKAAASGVIQGQATVTAGICAIGDSGPAPNYVDSGTIGTGQDASCDVPYPATVNENDILYAVVMDADDDTFSTPTDWNVLNNAIGITNLTVSIFWKRADGTETGTETFTSASSNGQLVAGIMHRYSGCIETGTPHEQYLSSGENQASTQTPAWLGDALGPNRLAIALLCVEDNTINAFTANGFVEDNRTATAVGSDAEFAAASVDVSGTTEPTACVWGTSQSEYHDVSGLYLKPTEGAKLFVGVISGKATVSGTLTDAGADGAINGEIDGIATVAGILSAKGKLEISIDALATIVGVLSAKGTLASAVNGVATVQGTLTAKGSLISTSNGVATVSGILTAKGALASIVNALATIQGILTGKGSLASIVNGVATVDGDLINASSIGELAGVINGVATVSGTLTAKGKLEGVSNGLATTQGDLMSRGILAGVSNGQATTQGVLTAKGILEGIISGLASLVGSLINNALVGVINSAATTQGILTAKGSLAGTSNGAATVSGILTTIPTIAPIDGVINGQATVSGTLIGKKQIEGTINGQATVQGELTPKSLLEGIISGLASVSGLLTFNGKIKGAAIGSATVVGTLTAKGKLEGIIDGNSSATLDPSHKKLRGLVLGLASVTGMLINKPALVGQINGVANVTGTLTDGFGSDIIGHVIGLANVTGVLIAKGKLEGATNGLADVTGIMGDGPKPKICEYIIVYNENPKFVVLYNESPKFIVTIDIKKYVVTFNCQKPTLCK